MPWDQPRCEPRGDDHRHGCVAGAPTSPVVLGETSSGRGARWPPGPSSTPRTPIPPPGLLINSTPARNLTEGDRYIVAGQPPWTSWCWRAHSRQDVRPGSAPLGGSIDAKSRLGHVAMRRASTRVGPFVGRRQRTGGQAMGTITGGEVVAKHRRQRVSNSLRAAFARSGPAAGRVGMLWDSPGHGRREAAGAPLAGVSTRPRSVGAVARKGTTWARRTCSWPGTSPWPEQPAEHHAARPDHSATKTFATAGRRASGRSRVTKREVGGKTPQRTARPGPRVVTGTFSPCRATSKGRRGVAPVGASTWRPTACPCARRARSDRGPTSSGGDPQRWARQRRHPASVRGLRPERPVKRFGRRRGRRAVGRSQYSNAYDAVF